MKSAVDEISKYFNCEMFHFSGMNVFHKLITQNELATDANVCIKHQFSENMK